jgi:regulator of protease activity HflC (stomatin/prohibitin superfamily)
MALFYKIPDNHVVLIERFGKHSRVQTSGLRIKLPFFESFKEVENWEGIANKGGYQLDLSEQLLNTPRRQFKTLENITIFADLAIGWKITDVVKAVYSIDVLPTSIVYVGMKALRRNIGDLYLDQVLADRQRLNAMITERISEVSRGWGIEITKVETYIKCDSLDKKRNQKNQSSAKTP